MNAKSFDASVIDLAAEIKRICAPPPETNHRKRDRKLFVQGYIMRQEDALYGLLARAKTDEKGFWLLVAVAQHYLCESEVNRFKSQSAFENGWGRRKPGKARAQIADDLDYLLTKSAKLIAEAQSYPWGGGRGDANTGLNVIQLAAEKGIRIAGLIELAGYDAVRGARLADLIQLLDNKPEPALQS